jgi:hypothetical protein
MIKWEFRAGLQWPEEALRVGIAASPEAIRRKLGL